MRSAPAPAGYYTVVEVVIRLANERSLTYEWTTPMALARAFHKAPAWARLEMRKAGVRGRTRITGISVEARYRAGSYKR